MTYKYQIMKFLEKKLFDMVQQCLSTFQLALPVIVLQLRYRMPRDSQHTDTRIAFLSWTPDIHTPMFVPA